MSDIIINIKGKNNERNIRYKKNRKKQRRCQLKINEKVRKGILNKPNKCSFCNNKFDDKNLITGHHFNYKHYLNIIWVCQNCHNLIHQNGFLKEIYVKVDELPIGRIKI